MIISTKALSRAICAASKRRVDTGNNQVDQVDLHLVSGFLGSGKTTAIIQAAQILIAQGKRVGIVTNDQGKYLVDTAFIRGKNFPAVEVSGGCFCCNYASLTDRLQQLKENEHPDVIFAESVGSCGDMVATVIKPLQDLVGSDTPPTSFSVFADSRLLVADLQREELPFSENVIYIFHKQIEEANLLIVNKVDLLDQSEFENIKTLSKAAYPKKIILFQNSLQQDDVQAWLRLINDGQADLNFDPIRMDYLKYGLGEAELAWLDEEIRIICPASNPEAITSDFLQGIARGIERNHGIIAHSKAAIKIADGTYKVSITQHDKVFNQPHLNLNGCDEMTVLLNIRAQISPEKLRAIVEEVLRQISKDLGVALQEIWVDYFQPEFPSPTHRYS